MTKTTYRIEMASNADGPWIRMDTQQPNGLSEAKEWLISLTKGWPGFHFRIVRVDETVEVVE